jgi:hypothetical protein
MSENKHIYMNLSAVRVANQTHRYKLFRAFKKKLQARFANTTWTTILTAIQRAISEL